VGSLPTKKTVTALVSDPANPQVLYASSGDGVFKSPDAGTSWQPMNTGLRETQIVAVALNPVQPTHLYAASASGQIFRSTDGAATWQRQGQLPME
jgi:photosystem II stability/assembly factor-like uncharacterized protein